MGRNAKVAAGAETLYVVEIRLVIGDMEEKLARLAGKATLELGNRDLPDRLRGLRTTGPGKEEEREKDG